MRHGTPVRALFQLRIFQYTDRRLSIAVAIHNRAKAQVAAILNRDMTVFDR